MAHGFSDANFQHIAIEHKNAAGFQTRIGSHIAQKIGTRVFDSCQQYLWNNKGRPRFKGIKRPLHSIESKNNAAILRWDSENFCLVINKHGSIAIVDKNVTLKKDEWLWIALSAKVKYCRLVRRYMGSSRECRYYGQWVMEGPAPLKSRHQEPLAAQHTLGGLDSGPTKLAWVTESEAGIFKFCEPVIHPAKEIARLQRQLSRQMRANNPDNFKTDRLKRQGNKTVVALGTVIKGRRQWKQSVAQRKTQNKIAALHAHAAKCRANSHGSDINDLLSVARTWRHDNVSVLSLQKNYGRSMSLRAPGRFMSELKRKAERACGERA